MFEKLLKDAHKKSGASDGGFTLIEVIVAMVIVAIACIPLLNGLVVSTKSNVKAQELAEGTSCAQYVMDRLQSFGAERVKSQFWSAVSGVSEDDVKVETPFTIFTVGSGDYKPTGADYGEALSKDAVPGGDSAMYYAVQNMDFGNGKYDIKIKYDPTSYQASGTKKSSYNTNSFVDVKAMNNGSSVVIAPEAALMSTPDKNTKPEFVHDTMTYRNYELEETLSEREIGLFYDQYVRFYTAIVAELNNQLTVYNASPESNFGIERFGITRTEQDEKDIKDMLRSNTDRKIALKVTKNSDDEYITDCKGVYYLKNGTNGSDDRSIYKKDKNGNTIDIMQIISNFLPSVQTGNMTNGFKLTDGENGQIGAIEAHMTSYINTRYNSLITEYSVDFKADAKTSKPPLNIFLMYVPLEKFKWKSDSLYVDISTVLDKSGSSLYAGTDGANKLRLYVVPQIGLADNINSSIPLNVKKADITFGETSVSISENSSFPNDLIQVYGVNPGTGSKSKSSAGGYDFVNVGGTGNAVFISNYEDIKAENDIAVSGKSENIIYDITISVYKYGGGDHFDSSNYVTELTLSGS